MTLPPSVSIVSTFDGKRLSESLMDGREGSGSARRERQQHNPHLAVEAPRGSNGAEQMVHLGPVIVSEASLINCDAVVAGESGLKSQIALILAGCLLDRSLSGTCWVGDRAARFGRAKRGKGGCRD